MARARKAWSLASLCAISAGSAGGLLRGPRLGAAAEAQAAHDQEEGEEELLGEGVGHLDLAQAEGGGPREVRVGGAEQVVPAAEDDPEVGVLLRGIGRVVHAVVARADQ